MFYFFSRTVITPSERFGIIWGTYLTIKMFIKYQSWCAGGFDPVPEKFGRYNG